MPEIPAIAHFCSLFKSSFDLIDFEIDELENALLQLNPDDVFSATLVERLVVKLLTGCLPMYASKIHDGNFSTYLKQLIQSKKEEAEEDEVEFNFEDPFETNDHYEFCDLSTPEQIKIVYQLTEFRLQCDDVEKKLKDLDPEGLRINPIGIDSDNVIYWYFFGTRLYKEVKATRKSKPKKKGEDQSIDDDGEDRGRDRGRLAFPEFGKRGQIAHPELRTRGRTTLPKRRGCEFIDQPECRTPERHDSANMLMLFSWV